MKCNKSKPINDHLFRNWIRCRRKAWLEIYGDKQKKSWTAHSTLQLNHQIDCFHNLGQKSYGNGIKQKIGQKDHYYLSAPLPDSWGKDTIRKILDGNVEIGMSDKQVRIAIGNPDALNVTSSRHGQSEQWIYQDQLGNRTYLQFEYGLLTHTIE